MNDKASNGCQVMITPQSLPKYSQSKAEEHLLPPPPEYPGYRSDIRRSYEVLDSVSSGNLMNGSALHQSLSQPELAHDANLQNPVKSLPSYNLHVKQSGNQDYAAIAARASKMVEILSEENKSLRNELENYYRKVSKLQKFEQELQKVHEAHDNLVKSSIKKDELEKAIRLRQELDLKRSEEKNKNFEDKLAKMEKHAAEQMAIINELGHLVSQHEETIQNLTKISSECKEELDRTRSKHDVVSRNLEVERMRCVLLEEDLNAYKSNASALMEEESEVKMAALQQSTKESERIIQEAQAEKIKYMDEAHQALKKIAHLEARVKSLEAACAEKDAIVRVLQRRQRSNLSGRNQQSAINSDAQHARRTSEPTNTLRTVGHMSVEDLVGTLVPSEPLQAHTWLV